ncbi:MAG: response regulator transcription factor [Bacteroidales bacterium]
MKARVLLVDDKPEFRKLTRMVLSRDYDVESVENGLEALSLLQTGYLPDVIISDLLMPALDGVGFIKQVKSSGAFQKIPVIVLSSLDKSAERVKLFQLGANDFIIKPFNPEELLLRVQLQLKRSA